MVWFIMLCTRVCHFSVVFEFVLIHFNDYINMLLVVKFVAVMGVLARNHHLAMINTQMASSLQYCSVLIFYRELCIWTHWMFKFIFSS